MPPAAGSASYIGRWEDEDGEVHCIGTNTKLEQADGTEVELVMTTRRQCAYKLGGKPYVGKLSTDGNTLAWSDKRTWRRERGVAWVEPTGKPDFWYFVGFGRGYLTRLAFQCGRVKFEHIQISFEEWPKVKADPKSIPAQVFGNMPVIVHGKFKISQATACTQYAWDLGINKVSPPTPYSRAMDMMVLAAGHVIRTAMYEVNDPRLSFGAVTDELREIADKANKYVAEIAHPILRGLERLYGESAGPFLFNALSSGPTLADFEMYNLIKSNFPGLEKMDVDMTPYPKLLRCAESVREVIAKSFKVERDGAPAPVGVDPDAKVELIYKPLPFRAELTRLALHAGGIEFTDTMLEPEEWKGVLEDDTSFARRRFHQLPLLVHGDLVLAESVATAQYAADIGLYMKRPPTAMQRALDMMMVCTNNEMLIKMFACYEGDEKHFRREKTSLKSQLARFLVGIERLYVDAAPFLYRSEKEGPSLGDLALLDLVTSSKPGLRVLEVDLSPYPRIEACVAACQSTRAHPGLTKYLEKRGF